MGLLKLELQQKQQEIAELHLQLEASTQVSSITPCHMSQEALLALLESTAYVCSGEWHVLLNICTLLERLLALLAREA